MTFFEVYNANNVINTADMKQAEMLNSNESENREML
jgi:hypothetical protein